MVIAENTKTRGASGFVSFTRFESSLQVSHHISMPILFPLVNFIYLNYFSYFSGGFSTAAALCSGRRLRSLGRQWAILGTQLTPTYSITLQHPVVPANVVWAGEVAFSTQSAIQHSYRRSGFIHHGPQDTYTHLFNFLHPNLRAKVEEGVVGEEVATCLH